MNDPLTTVTICWTAVEAGFLRHALEEQGIRCFVRESHLGTIDPFVTPALGGIRLDVDTEHLERARAIVATVRASRPAKEEPGPWIEDDDRCPACREFLAEESDDCPACGWTLADAGKGEAVPLPSRRVPSRPAVPGRGGIAAGWIALALCCGVWLLGEVAQSVFFPATGPPPDWTPTAAEIPILALGGLLLLGAGFLAITRGFRGRVRPYPSLAGTLAQGMAAALLLDEGLRILERKDALPRHGAMGWFLLPFLGPALAVAWPALRDAGIRRTRAALGLVRGKGYLREAAIGVLAFPAVLTVEVLCDWLLRPGPRPYHGIYDWLLADSGWYRFWGCAAVLVQTPITEELVFRGAIYRFFRNSGGVAAAVVGSSLLFAVWHLQGWGAIPYLACFGAGAALLREWRGSLVAPMAMHSASWAYNLALLAMATA